ncbi:MAG TPA: hypothetical protein VFK06_25285 [Candidatus Angelobacter sp.]|nr:hypothetical protein [Candidatus Angelobacter sp.]
MEYTSGIPAHLAFDRLHQFLHSLEQKSRRSFHVAELSADLWIAARFALRYDRMLWEFYKLWAAGAADDIAPHVLARSENFYRIRSLVGTEILRRGLTHGYFKKRQGRKR